MGRKYGVAHQTTSKYYRSVSTDSLDRHVHCVEGALQNKVRIQLVHFLKELLHSTLSLVCHHKELHTLVSKDPFQHGKFKVEMDNYIMRQSLWYCAILIQKKYIKLD